MIGTRLFRRYYGVTVGIVVAFALLAFTFTHIVMRMNPPPPGGTVHTMLFDANGTLLMPVPGAPETPVAEPLPFQWDAVKKPERPYEFKSFPLVDPKGARRGHGTLVRLEGEPTRYLFVGSVREHPRGAVPIGAALAFGSTVLAVLLGVGLSFLLVLRSLREKAQTADAVLAELQRGNLKARFPIRRMDEIGMAMNRFNRMAEEIERLVEGIRSGERARVALLQELAHDLRTPVASLKSLLETLSSPKAAADAALSAELRDLAFREADYFGRLVEDLLTLAQVSEPRYQAHGEWMALADLIEDEAASLATNDAGKIALKKELGDRDLMVLGDPHLLRRMLRNILDNAFSFARSEVRVYVARENDDFVSIRVEDDGPGFSQAALVSYGERRVTRIVDSTRTHRVSVGLGSVIVKTVARLHGGEVIATNHMSEGEIAGARIEVRMPVTAPRSKTV